MVTPARRTSNKPFEFARNARRTARPLSGLAAAQGERYIFK